jgi:hypothetical protein
MDILARLLESPGIYVGTVQDFSLPDEERKLWNARIVVAPLPGRASVSIDYECLSQEHGRFHVEHSVLGRLPEGRVLVVAHPHGDTVLLLHEDEPGHFVDRDHTSRFPVEHVIEMPEPGRILHRWRYGAPGEEIVERDTADVRLIEG